jgi:hypothetical protein
MSKLFGACDSTNFYNYYHLDKLRRSSKKYREIIIDSNLDRVNYNSIPVCLQFYKLVLVVMKIINQSIDQDIDSKFFLKILNCPF